MGNAAPQRYASGTTKAQHYRVEVELPGETFRHRPWSPADVAADLRQLWLVDQVRQRRLGYARAAELAGMPQAAFVQVLGAHRVPSIDLDEHELEQELAAAADLGRT